MRVERTLLTAAARPWFWCLSVIASVVQLLTISSLAVRVGLLGGLVVLAAVSLAYNFGRSRRHNVGPDPHTASAYLGTESALVGKRLVKVASRSGKVALVNLHENRVLYEQWLPLTEDDVRDNVDLWRGNWLVDDGSVRIIVRGYNLGLRPAADGMWQGIEQYAEGSEEFLAVVVDPTPLRTGAAWVGLKLGEYGVRRVIVATGDGRLHERDPFGGQKPWQGQWTLTDADCLSINVDKWQLHAREQWPGIMIGSETSPSGRQGFAIVRAVPLQR
jgi:hypothetical protein